MKILLILFLYLVFISVLQFSFLPAIFPFFGLPNLILIFVSLYTILENPNKNIAYYLAIFGGLINDFMSPGIFIYFILFYFLVFGLKLVFRNYVQLSF